MDASQRHHSRVTICLASHPLHNRPPAREVNLIDAELLLPIGIPNARINIVIVQHRPQLRIVIHALSTRPIHPTMRLEHRRPAPIRATHARLVHEPARRARRPTHLDLVLLPRGRLVRIEAAALAHGEEEVVVVSVLGNEGGFLGVRARGLVRDAGGGRARGDGQGRVVHAHRVQVAPEGAEGHDDVGAVVVGGAVDGVVGAAGLGGDAGCAVVGPGVEVGGGGDADGGVLRAEGGHRVEEVVGVAEFGDVRGL